MKNVPWHARFKQQAGWTKNLRNHLSTRFSLPANPKILDVGCGTGVLLPEQEALSESVFGLDKDMDALIFAHRSGITAHLVCADAVEMPLPDHYFDLTFCHYLLMWITDPIRVVNEMARITRPGGYVVAYAEPDYQARIDHPEVFQRIGQLQNHSLQFQGVNLSIGRQLGQLLSHAGLNEVRSGVLAGEWTEQTAEDFEREWAVIAYDLGGLVTPERILELRREASHAWVEGSITLYIPTLYAFGMV
jgi:ubiquinone/menaquinone biosynthesis C-methylase UbiE